MSIPATVQPARIIDSRAPNYLSTLNDWQLWRLTYIGGEPFRNKYLEKFSNRETPQEFLERKRMTPTPTFAKAAVNEIRNSIFQRMRDIVRRDGSNAYQRAIGGNDLGVDLRGSTMNYFMGFRVLTELLTMGKVGVYVDMPEVQGDTKVAALRARPYLYLYQIEDILSWSCSKPEQPSEYQSLLLRDTCIDYDRRTLLPLQTFERFRRLWVDQETGKVNCQFYSLQGDEIDRDGNPSEGPVVLDLNRIPFVMLDIGDSIIKDVCGHQIALLNLASSDVSYALKANFPIYVEQTDARGGARTHLKQSAAPDGSATTGGQGAETNEIKVGVTQGRYYDIKANPPGFINPSSEPLQASMQLAQKLEGDIRKLVNLAVASAGAAVTGKNPASDQGLEAGLSFIGLALENAERRIGELWASYEDTRPTNQQIPVVKYPDIYSLKNDSDRITESENLSKLIFTVPGQTAKKEIAKTIVTTLLAGKIGVDVMQDIYDEIDEAEYTTSDPDTIIAAREQGIVGDQIASMALGFDEDQYLVARDDHAARIKRIQMAQMPPSAIEPPINPWTDTNTGYGPTNGTTAGAEGPTQSPDPLATIGFGNSNDSDPAARSPADLSNPPRKSGNPDAIEKPGVTGSDPAARGLKDISANPDGGKAEKAASRNTDLSPTGRKRVRGRGKKIRKAGA